MVGATCVVTGGSGAIGRLLCRQLAEGGTRVVNLDVKAPSGSLEGVEDVRVDLCAEAELRAAAARIAERNDVAALVNNAGLVFPAALEDIGLADLQRLVDLHLKAAVVLAQALVPGMKARKHGRIVNLATRAQLGKHGRSSYAATKLGLVAFTRTWALELGPYGITVNAVAPGPIATEMFLRNNSAQVKEETLAATAVKRFGKPEDVTNAIRFLLSPDSGFITGQVLYVCGGMSITSAPL
jgi:NAD(P)-dependent dehydrogenase (short-subunit alcohol dehydrogenase family)